CARDYGSSYGYIMDYW
nr:immunoglobulin heavy chain junction region [Mus musculus]MBK4184078.1 immunoglobulin heavy chain junction region [Mus musculus]